MPPAPSAKTGDERVSKRHLVVRLDAPLMSFGGVAIDNHGETDAWPAASLLAGIVGNALGLRRTEGAALQDLQDRLVFACRADREGQQTVDYQTAELKANEVGWTTRGQPEGRAGGADTYKGKHIRFRHFWADRIVTLAFRMEKEPTAEEPDRIARALEAPARPLFIGRKPFLPAAPLFVGWSEGESTLEAVARAPLPEDAMERTKAPEDCSAFAPAHDTPHPFIDRRCREIWTSGARNWTNDTHGGAQRWLEGRIAVIPESPA